MTWLWDALETLKTALGLILGLETYVEPPAPEMTPITRESEVRGRIEARARNLLGIRYVLGAEDADLRIETRPPALDCSEAVELAYSQEAFFTHKMPDGAVNQHVFCQKVIDPQQADLGFMRYWSDKSKKVVWHVGILTSKGTVIHASGSRGEVVEDRRSVFASHHGFIGWGRHPEFKPEA